MIYATAQKLKMLSSYKNFAEKLISRKKFIYDSILSQNRGESAAMFEKNTQHIFLCSLDDNL